MALYTIIRIKLYYCDIITYYNVNEMPRSTNMIETTRSQAEQYCAIKHRTGMQDHNAQYNNQCRHLNYCRTQ